MRRPHRHSSRQSVAAAPCHPRRALRMGKWAWRGRCTRRRCSCRCRPPWTARHGQCCAARSFQAPVVNDMCQTQPPCTGILCTGILCISTAWQHMLNHTLNIKPKHKCHLRAGVERGIDCTEDLVGANHRALKPVRATVGVDDAIGAVDAAGGVPGGGGRGGVAQVGLRGHW